MKHFFSYYNLQDGFQIKYTIVVMMVANLLALIMISPAASQTKAQIELDGKRSLEEAFVRIPISTAQQGMWPSVAWDGQNYFVIWAQSDEDCNCSKILGARVTPAGKVLDSPAIPIATAPIAQYYPSITWGGKNFLVVWFEEHVDTRADIFGARVSPEGMALDPTGIPICTLAGHQLYPDVASNGELFLVVWADDRLCTGCRDLYGARVNADGSVLDTDNIPISTTPGVHPEPRVVSDGKDFFVVWEDHGSDYRRRFGIPVLIPALSKNGEIRGTKVSSQGIVLDPPGIPISGASPGQSKINPHVAWNGENFLVVWESGGIHGRQLHSDGSIVNPSTIDFQKLNFTTTIP